jgi:hypothetical protein
MVYVILFNGNDGSWNFVAPNARMISKGWIAKMWKKAAVTYLNLLFRDLPKGLEKTQ